MTSEMVERRIVTVLFADLVEFTTLSEQFDAEDVAAVQDSYFAMAREAIGRYGGRVEKFIGDAVMAVFGIPRTRDDDVERAVRAGLALVHGVQQIGARLGIDDGMLRLRVGINTGEAVLASAPLGEGRVTGDTVNTAARLQTAAPAGSLLVGDNTALAIADLAELEPAGQLELKGKSAMTAAWLVRGLRSEPSRERAMGALSAPTLGREAELRSLRAAQARVVEGAVEHWLIVAPPGVGKSRLLREFGADVNTGVRLWRSRCRPDAVSVFDPIARLLLGALASAVTPAVDGAGLLRQRLAELGASDLRSRIVIDAVRSVIGEDAAPAIDRSGNRGLDREALFEAWLDALDALAGGAAAAWLVEDVHWGGGDVLAFLELAGSRQLPGRPGRLVLSTARPSLLEAAPSWGQASESVGRHVVHLPTLNSADTQALIHALVEDALPADLVERIAERSDGNCLFVEELLRTWVSVGTLARERDGRWRLTVPAADVALPASVQSIYAAQLDDLPAAARQVARRASIVGRRFPVAALAPLGADADDGLPPLRRRELLAGPVSEPIWGEAFAFRHALLRDAGYASLARAERARLHVRLARWLERAAGAPAAGARAAEIAEMIAAHYAAALDSAPALAIELDEGVDRLAARVAAADWYERAGEAALALAAHAAARTLLRQAIDLTPDDALLDWARRWQRLAEATAYAADMDEGAAAFEHAIELYRRGVAASGAPVAARVGLARSVAGLADVWYQQLRFAEARDMCAAALDELPDLPPAEHALLLSARAMGAQGAIGMRADTLADLERAIELATAAGDERVKLRALGQLIAMKSEQGEAEPGQWLELEELAARLGEWHALTSALINGADVDERHDEAFERAERARAVAEAHGMVEDAGWADYLVAEVGLVSGDWDRAWAAGLRAVDLGEANAYRRLTVRNWHVLIPIAASRGDRALLERAASWYAGLAGPFPDSPYARLVRPAQGVELAAAGIIEYPVPDVEPRLESFEEEPGGPSWTAAADRLFRAWLEAGEVDGAGRALAAMTNALPRYPRISALGLGTYHLLRGRLAEASHDPLGASAAGRMALEQFRRSRAPWWIAKAIRLLERAGAADEELLSEVGRIERSLRLIAPTA